MKVEARFKMMGDTSEDNGGGVLIIRGLEWSESILVDTYVDIVERLHLLL